MDGRMDAGLMGILKAHLVSSGELKSVVMPNFAL